MCGRTACGGLTPNALRRVPQKLQSLCPHPAIHQVPGLPPQLVPVRPKPLARPRYRGTTTPPKKHTPRNSSPNLQVIFISSPIAAFDRLLRPPYICAAIQGHRAALAQSNRPLALDRVSISQRPSPLHPLKAFLPIARYPEWSHFDLELLPIASAPLHVRILRQSPSITLNIRRRGLISQLISVLIVDIPAVNVLA